ncbi:hypothetical protein D3C79_873540 [compost metagenome]
MFIQPLLDTNLPRSAIVPCTPNIFCPSLKLLDTNDGTGAVTQVLPSYHPSGGCKNTLSPCHTVALLEGI